MSMTISDLPLSGLKLIELEMYVDERGFFVERFNEACFQANGLPTRFAQDNHSRSQPRTLRGLHYQTHPAQGKLIGVTRGHILDVVVDIRPKSATFGAHVARELSDANGCLMWIPPGFAHGFCVIGDSDADVVYKVDQPYSRSSEGGILWSDPELQIAWPLKDPIVSARDRTLPSFTEYRHQPVEWP
jgi:dTDP-4-dehydrorhamnose 3,5-epimerase